MRHPDLVAASVLHAPALAAIHAAAVPEGERWDAVAFAALLGPGGALGVIDPDGGFAIARVAADQAEIVMLAVAPDRRRRGLGTALLAAAEGRAGTLGAAAMFLEVARGNAPARALYDSAGYRQVGLRRRYYPNGDDALVLRRDLTPCG